MQCNIQLPTALSHLSFSQHHLKNMHRKIIFIIPAVSYWSSWACKLFLQGLNIYQYPPSTLTVSCKVS